MLTKSTLFLRHKLWPHYDQTSIGQLNEDVFLPTLATGGQSIVGVRVTAPLLPTLGKLWIWVWKGNSQH